MSNNQPPLTVQAATETLGVSDKTVRRLLKRGVLEKAGEVHGRILITAASVERVKQHIPPLSEVPAAPPSNGYAMVPASHYEALQHAHTILAETVRDQAAYIRQLQERIAELEAQQRYASKAEEHERAITELRAELDRITVDSPGSSLRSESKPEGSAMRRMLRRLFG
jgi:hypothetical protein